MAMSAQLYPQTKRNQTSPPNPLPELVQTPSGLAILELQGTINLPPVDESGEDVDIPKVEIGRLTFPDYQPEMQDPSSTAWMKSVHLYVGQHQRLTGEVKKLPRPLAIIRKKSQPGNDTEVTQPDPSIATGEDLEIVEIVKYKLVFSQRPEPVGTG